MLEELSRDHRLVDDSLRRLRALVDGLDEGADPVEALRELDSLAALMETHFVYEEKRIVAALNALDVPDWEGSRPPFLELDEPGGGPYAITTGPDGALWFTLNQANAIGRIDVEGTVAIHPLPTEAAAPVGIAAGDGGAVVRRDRRGADRPDHPHEGRITEFPLPDREARPRAIVRPREVRSLRVCARAPGAHPYR
nr:hypothetical protein GCM10010200_051250 [Actinomadura rugatobispora]